MAANKLRVPGQGIEYFVFDFLMCRPLGCFLLQEPPQCVGAHLDQYEPLVFLVLRLVRGQELVRCVGLPIVDRGYHGGQRRFRGPIHLGLRYQEMFWTPAPSFLPAVTRIKPGHIIQPSGSSWGALIEKVNYCVSFEICIYNLMIP